MNEREKTIFLQGVMTGLNANATFQEQAPKVELERTPLKRKYKKYRYPKTWKLWTEQEDAYIKENFNHMTTKEMMRELPGRTYIAILARIKKLGLAGITRTPGSTGRSGIKFYA